MALILANDGIDLSAQKALEKLGHTVDTKKYEGDDLLKRLAEVDCIVIRSATKMRDPQIDAGAAGKLKLIIRAGVGIDNINVAHAKEMGVAVDNTPAASSNAVAEIVLGQMFVLARNLHRANRSMPQGKWLKKEYSGSEIMGKTLGVIGFGRIGQCLAKKAIALGMTVIFADPFVEHVDGCERVSNEEIFKRADFISLHTPAQEKPLLGDAEFAQMKDGVFVINYGRGGVIDEDALLRAIESGKVRGASLDCFKEEPLARKDLMECDQLSLTPHIGAATDEAQERIGDIIVEKVQAFFK